MIRQNLETRTLFALPTLSCWLAIYLGNCLTRGNQTVDVVVEDKHHESNE